MASDGDTEQPQASHLHDEVQVRVIVQRDGVPHEVRRTVCRDCGRVLREEPVRRTAA